MKQYKINDTDANWRDDNNEKNYHMSSKKDITFINNCVCGFPIMINVSLACKLKKHIQVIFLIQSVVFIWDTSNHS